MTITAGDRIPAATVYQKIDGARQAVSSDELLGTGKVLLFALPGAFTKTCSAAHLPGYVVHADAIHEAGVDRIACLSVNDADVMDAWGRDQNVEDNILMIGDALAEFTRAIGLEVDLSAGGLGLRSQRYAMLIKDGIVEHLAIEKPGQFEVSDAESLLAVLKSHQAA